MDTASGESCFPTLDYTSVFMILLFPPLQRTPAVYCVRLAKTLVGDYCGLVPGSVQTLKQIFNVSPRFCCQFITAVAALYDMSSGKSGFVYPFSSDG